MDKESVTIIGAFLMDPGGGAEHPSGAHDPLGWAAIYAPNTKLSLSGVWCVPTILSTDCRAQ